MPYLTQKARIKFDRERCENIIRYLTSLSIQDFAGHINYFVFKATKRWVEKNGKKYFIFATIIGTMICCILEIYRRLVANYEDKAIKKNGDVK